VRTVSKPGQEISIETIENSSGDFLILAPPGETAKTEILNTIKILQETGRRAYIKIEDEEKEVRDYKFQLQDIFDRYQDKENTTGNLTDQEVDNFQDEVVIIATRLQPVDRDVFFKFFTELEPIKKLGISIDSLEKTVDKLHSISAKEKQTQDLINLLKEATDTAQKGNTNQALENLTKKLNQVKSTDKEEEFKKIIKPTNEEEIKKSLKNKVEYLDSGYKIDKEDLLLPTGALSIFTAPTSHGKTTFLINLAINLVKTYQDKEVYFFSFEEDSTAIQIKSLNCYLDKQISGKNLDAINHYFKTGSTKFIREPERDYFLIKKEEFFQDYLSTGRLNISYTDFDAQSLVELIYYLHKNRNPLAIFIDYIQLLNLPQGKYKTYSRQEEVKTICNLLKNVSVDTGLPIILGAQFNRQVKNLIKIHPTEISEAGDIERFANLIVGFWNIEHKEVIQDSEKKEIEKKKGKNYSGLYTTVLKNRGGKVGQEEVLYFNGNTRTIKNNS
jgi:replicative DNA helicase